MLRYGDDSFKERLNNNRSSTVEVLCEDEDKDDDEVFTFILAVASAVVDDAWR